MYLLALQQEDCQGSRSYGVPIEEGTEKGERKEEHFESTASRAVVIFQATSKERGDNQHGQALTEPETGLYTLENNTGRKRRIP